MIAITFDVDAFVAELTDLEKRRLPYASALAVNRTVEEAQIEIRSSIPRRLTIRQASTLKLMRQAVYFGKENRADDRRGKADAELQILGEGSARTKVLARVGSILIRQNVGGVRLGRHLVLRRARGVVGGLTQQFAGHIIPFEGLRTDTKPMKRSLFPVNIGLSPRRRIAGGEELASSYKGGKKVRGGFKKNTKYYFATQRGIFVRNQLANKQSEYDGVWWFKPRITLRPRLGFEDTFTRVVNERVVLNFTGALLQARRGRGT